MAVLYHISATLLALLSMTARASTTSFGPSTTCSYEDIEAKGLVAVGIGKQPISKYCGLQHDQFGLGIVSILGTQPIMPLGDQFAIGGTGSKLSKTSRPVSFDAAFFACFLSTTQGQTPGVNCDIKITGKSSGQELSQVCKYDGGTVGTVQKCELSSFKDKAVDSVRFDVTSFVSLVGDVIKPVGDAVGIDAGQVLIAMDNVTYRAINS